MKYLTIILFLIFGITIIFSGCVTQNNTIKIGIIVPLSGNNAIYGDWSKKALDIAQDEINKQGVNGKKIELIYEDGQFDSAKTVEAFNKLRNIDNVSYVLTMGSSPALAVSPLANDYNIIQMDFSATTSLYRTKDDFTFRTCPRAEQFGDDSAKWFIDNNIFSVGVLYINNDQGKSIFNEFKTKYESLGGKINANDTFEQNGLDFKSSIVKVLQNKTDYLFLIGHLSESGLILKQMNELGYYNPILSHVYSVEGKVFLDNAGNFKNNIIYFAPAYSPELNDFTKAYDMTYFAKYNEHSEYFGAFAYDELNVLSLAISKCNDNNTICVKSELFKIKDYQGLTGNVTFDEYGDRIVDLGLKTIKDNNFVKYE